MVGSSKFTVRLTSLTKATITTLSANQDGIFRAVNLLPDRYRLEAEVAGFKKLVQEPLVVESNRILTADLQLELGDTAQTLEIGWGSVAWRTGWEI